MNAIPTTRPKRIEAEMVEMKQRTEMAAITVPQSRTSKQNFRLLIALSLLLAALAVVLVKDREFWFGSEQALDSEAAPENIARTNPVAVPAKAVTAPVQSAAAAKRHVVSKPSAQPFAAPKSADSASQVVAGNRVVLPPLDVEVVAGDSHRTVRAGSNVAKVEIPSDSARASAAMASLPANAAERERLSSASVPELRQTQTQTADATYPLLGQHSKVQGSVVLQAVIGADGNIENLRVLSGPAILATAAQQAVRQWRFKPYLQNGQPVETKTKITVNFSIRVADNPATTS